MKLDFDDVKIADQGCGKLRHLKFFCRIFKSIYLIETDFQLTRLQRLFGKNNTNIREFLVNFKPEGIETRLYSAKEFRTTKLNLDIIFNICVFDVEIPDTRKELAEVSYRNLKKGGLFVLIVPRNISSIMKRCKSYNKHLDGFYFNHHGITTFYRNFASSNSIINDLSSLGYYLITDLSTRGYICLIFKK